MVGLKWGEKKKSLLDLLLTPFITHRMPEGGESSERDYIIYNKYVALTQMNSLNGASN